MNLNVALAILIAVLGVLMASTAQLNDLFGPPLAHSIVSVAGLLNAIIASILAVLSGNVAMLKNVVASPALNEFKSMQVPLPPWHLLLLIQPSPRWVGQPIKFKLP
jgi:hypothetical protein